MLQTARELMQYWGGNKIPGKGEKNPWRKPGPLPECSSVVPPKEQNLKQMNAIYDANPRILEDVHRAVQGGKEATFHDEEG